jgi:hypothetical protein
MRLRHHCDEAFTRTRAPKRCLVAIAGVYALAAFAAASWAAPFTPGNLVVTRVIGGPVDPFAAEGTFSAPTSAANLEGNGVAATLWIEEYTPAGGFVQSIPMPNVRRNSGTGNYALTLSGTQNGEGQISLSGNGQYFVVTGYNQTAKLDGATGANGSNAAASTLVQRVIGRIAMDGTYDTTTALLDAGSTRSARSVYSTNGTEFWFNAQSGSTVTIDTEEGVVTSGIRYATLGASRSTSVAVHGAPNPQANDHRMLNVFNGQLYVSNTSSSTTDPDLYKVGTGIPTTSMNTLDGVTGLAGLTGNLFDDYWFKDETTLYAADNRRRASLDGGIRKYVYEDTDADTIADTWVFKYHVQLGAQVGPTFNTDDPPQPNVGARSLAGRVEGANTVIYATTIDDTGANRNLLVKVVDNGMGMTSTTLLTSPFQDEALSQYPTAFRGVEIVPAGTAPVINANFDGTGGVNGHDFLIWQRGLGTGTTLAQGDSNGSNSVDATDLANWRAQYGTLATATAAAVPEPTGAALVGLIALTQAAKRRR